MTSLALFYSKKRGMRFRVLTHKGIYNLDSNFINYLFPSNSFKTYCKSMELKNGEIITSNKNRMETYAGDLKKSTTEVNGALKRQKMLENLDHANRLYSKHLNRVQDRIHWKNQASIPKPNRTVKPLAPIKPSTNMTPKATASAGIAMAVGIIAQKARSGVLLQDIKYHLKSVAAQIRKKHPNASCAVLVASVYYLKVNPDYGRAPSLRGVYFDEIIDFSSNINPTNYVKNKAQSLCLSSMKAKSDIYKELVDFNELKNKDIYDVASLFILCEW